MQYEIKATPCRFSTLRYWFENIFSDFIGVKEGELHPCHLTQCHQLALVWDYTVGCLPSTFSHEHAFLLLLRHFNIACFDLSPFFRYKQRTGERLSQARGCYVAL